MLTEVYQNLLLTVSCMPSELRTKELFVKIATLILLKHTCSFSRFKTNITRNIPTIYTKKICSIS